MKTNTLILLALGVGGYFLFRKLEDTIVPQNPVKDPIDIATPDGPDPDVPLPPDYGHDVIEYVPLPVRETDPAWFKDHGIL